MDLQDQFSEAQDYSSRLQLLLKELEQKLEFQEKTHLLQMNRDEAVIAKLELQVNKLYFHWEAVLFTFAAKKCEWYHSKAGSCIILRAYEKEFGKRNWHCFNEGT